MRVRVPLLRTLRQYTDVIVPNAESLEEAVAEVQHKLDRTLPAARLLRGVTWSDLDTTDIIVVEGAEEVTED